MTKNSWELQMYRFALGRLIGNAFATDGTVLGKLGS